MKIFYPILICLFSQITHAQTIDKLSESYGFSIFKLNTNPEYYKGNLKVIDGWSKNPNISGYTYTGNGFKTYLGINIKRIVLSFFQNKLMTIQIDFERPFSKNYFDVILNKLNNLYGNGTDCGNCGVPISGEFSSVTGINWNDSDALVRMTFFRGYSSYDGWCGVLTLYEGRLWKQRKMTDN